MKYLLVIEQTQRYSDQFQAKPFPQQSELVDRLDITLQWDEFKQETLKDYLRRRIRKH